MLRGSAYVLGLRIFGEGLGLLMVMVAGNYYSVEATGLLLTLQNNLFLFGTFGTIGLGTCFLRFVPVEHSAGQLDRVRGIMRWVYVVATLGLLIAAAVHAGFMSAAGTAGLGWSDLLLVGLAILVWGWVILGRHLLRALQLTFWSEVSYQVIRPLGGVMILLAGAMLDAPVSFVLPALLVPLLLCVVHDAWRTNRLVEGLSGAVDLSQRAVWSRMAMNFGLFNLARVTLQRLDLLVVTALLGLKVAAVYGLASRMALLASIAVDPIQAMFQPRAAKHHAENNQDALRLDMIIGGLWIFAAAAAVALFIPVTASLWLPLFGDVSQDGTIIGLLVIFVLGDFLNANSSIAAGYMLMTSNEARLARWYGVLIFLVFPPLLLLGTWTGGIWGAALATVTIRLAIAASAVFLAWRATGILIVPRPSPENLRVAFGPLLALLRRRS